MIQKSNIFFTVVDINNNRSDADAVKEKQYQQNQYTQQIPFQFIHQFFQDNKYLTFCLLW